MKIQIQKEIIRNIVNIIGTKDSKEVLGQMKDPNKPITPKEDGKRKEKLGKTLTKVEKDKTVNSRYFSEQKDNSIVNRKENFIIDNPFKDIHFKSLFPVKSNNKNPIYEKNPFLPKNQEVQMNIENRLMDIDTNDKTNKDYSFMSGSDSFFVNNIHTEYNPRSK